MQIILREIRYFYRDKANLFFAIFFPLMMVFLLGTMLQKVEVSEYDIGKVEAGYYLDADVTYASSLESFFDEVSENEDITFQAYTSQEEALAQLEKEELCAVAVFHKDGAEIVSGDNLTRTRAVKSMVDGYITIAGTYEAIITEKPVNAMDLTVLQQGLVEKKESIKSRTMIDYYAVTMLIMMVFMGGIATTCGSIYDDRKNTTLRRIDGSPANKTAVFLKLILGNIPYAIMQMAIIMLGSILMFQASYCVDLQGNLMLIIMLFVVSMTAIAFSAVLGLIFKKGNPQIFAMGISWVMLFFSGSFARNVYIEGVSDYLPTSLVQNAAFDLVIFGRYMQTIQVTIVSALLFVVFLVLGTILFNRREQL